MTTQHFHPFPYDPFQQRAIELIDRGVSLLVAAPTGSGKTVLADYVIERTLERHRRVIYTAPVKALSNQKFRDFTARHGEEVGIMTGDVTINPTAPLIIMTTEIYRNTLLEDPARLSRYAWVIFDEIHYLDDPERGTVWEESLLFTPSHMNLLCLSATIPNVAQLAHWIRTIHGRPIEVIEETHRPVPLTTLFQCQNAILTSPEDLKQRGYHGHSALGLGRPHHGRRAHVNAPANRLHPLIHHLQEQERLPCIFFTFGRRRAEDLAWELSDLALVDPSQRATLRRLYTELCARFQLQHDQTAEALGRLVDRGVAYHHAGMLPTVKEVIERCFTSRLLKLIVTTETFALGINMPARSVVLDTLKKRSGGGFELLRRREFLQMAGRAGRRGMDEAGFVYLRVNPHHVSFSEVQHLLQGEPEPVHSRFNTTYATLLNLFRRHGPALVELFPKTLYYFQTSGARRQAGLDLMQRKLELLRILGYLTPTTLTPKGEFGAWLYGHELLLTELHTDGRLDDLSVHELALLAAAIVFEPKPKMGAAKSHRVSKRLASRCAEPLARIHKEEARLRIAPRAKAPAFHLSLAMDAWLQKAAFAKLTRLCEVDEGEIVRYFRMAVQLLRQLAEAPAAEPSLRTAARKALERVNRDVVDAEAQLRLG
ncbi:MAG: DEAD/DEAH box helicase [Candidatus Omnitrophica bacterium]|nr:DEAD/DEAH box helicase [Candidatus Omnitrophota bacterium]